MSSTPLVQLQARIEAAAGLEFVTSLGAESVRFRNYGYFAKDD